MFYLSTLLKMIDLEQEKHLCFYLGDLVVALIFLLINSRTLYSI